MPYGKFKATDLELVPSDYLMWLMKQDWFVDKDDDLTVGVENELNDRDKWGGHFWDNKFER